MRDAWRHFASEFIGTFALVFVGSGAIMTARMSGSQAGLVEVALAHGIILAVMVSALMRISGHFNPAITLGFLAVRRIEVMMAALYIVAQVLGAIAAAYALKAAYPDSVFVATRGGGQAIALDITGGQAFILETIATFFLVFVVFGTAVDLKGPKIGGLAIGLTIAADILAIGPLTGASMNPARSFGPAVASGVYEAQLLYWAAPILGGLIAALMYEFLFLKVGREPALHGELRP
ncbi:MAG TPA: aquaporin [Gemmatimonadaceae bacterium]|jgi:MIP family channel proteins|nr:aquaporin [Gemmatimonadaceae bacterium]